MDKWIIVCTDCGYEFPTPVEKMKELPGSCNDCGGHSFRVEKDEPEELSDEEKQAQKEEPQMRIDALERMEEDKRDTRL